MRKKISSITVFIIILIGSVIPLPAAQYIEVPGVGWEGQGAGIAITNLDANPRPEMILMAYDNPYGDNTFRYRIGWNLNSEGIAECWDSDYTTVPGAGWEGQGAGIAIANLDDNARPEMIFMAYDNPYGDNNFRYRVGWNLNSDGIAEYWDDNYTIVPGAGWEGQGSGIAISNFDANPRPEMILMAYDNPYGDNSFRYRIGWNLNSDGIAAYWDDNYTVVQGAGWEGQGAGVAIANLDSNDRPEMIFMAYDNPYGDNTFRYRIGSNIKPNGKAQSWSAYKTIAGVSWEGQGADICVFNLNKDSRPEFIFMAYDSPAGANTFRYRILSNQGTEKKIHLEMDKLSTVSFPPSSVKRMGMTYTLPSIYEAAGISVNLVYNERDIKDLKSGQPYNDSDLYSFLNAHMNKPGPSGTWHMYCEVLTRHIDGLLGVMFDTGERRAFAVFAKEFSDVPNFLRTTAHELGHGLNLEHSDGDAYVPPGYPTEGEGHTIMNQTWTLATDWNFGWSAASLHHFYNHPLDRWKPRTGISFGRCHD
ncbi:MAG: hypothetical protein ACM3SY_15745 [Candidatus Omnitrophota bacterium]